MGIGRVICMVGEREKIPQEMLNFLDTLVYNMITEIEDKENIKRLKKFVGHFKQSGKDFYLGYYTGIILVITIFTFAQKYGREPDNEEVDEIINGIAEKSGELERAIVENIVNE